MPRLTRTEPTYRLHKASGKAVVTLNGKDFYLGVHGSPESKTEYYRLIAEYLGSNRQHPRAVAPTDAAGPSAYISHELAESFRETAEGYSGKIGICLSAAMVMFLEADPETQAKQMTRIVEAEFRGNIDSLLSGFKEERSRRSKSPRIDR